MFLEAVAKQKMHMLGEEYFHVVAEPWRFLNFRHYRVDFALSSR